MRWNWRFALFLVLLASCNTPPAQPAAGVTEADVLIPTQTPQANLPNPASVFCEEQGNRLEIHTAADGSQSGVCIFPDGSECDEWAYFRQECRPASSAPATLPASEAYSPELVTPDPALYAGWVEYDDPGYGFKFRYPPEWTSELDLRPNSSTYQHLLWLRAPGKPVPCVEMHIAFERLGENRGLQRTGIGAGELIDRGSVLFLGESTRRIVLVLEGVDMEVMYGNTGVFQRGDLRFAISLAYVGVERIGLPPELEQTGDLIVASFERTQ